MEGLDTELDRTVLNEIGDLLVMIGLCLLLIIIFQVCWEVISSHSIEDLGKMELDALK